MFFENLKKLCSARGISVSRLAMEVGKPSSSATGWKAGARPRADTLKKIADYFGVTTDTLLSDNGTVEYTRSEQPADDVRLPDEQPEPPLTEQESEIIRIYNVLDLKHRTKLLNYAYELESATEPYRVSAPDGGTIREVFRDAPLYRLKASAGTGVFLDSNEYDIVKVGPEVPLSMTFGVRIDGDSMEPKYPDGHVAWVRMSQALEIGQVGIFMYNGDGYIKKLGRGELISLNPKYAPMHLKPDDEFRVYGSVVAVTEDVYS